MPGLQASAVAGRPHRPDAVARCCARVAVRRSFPGGDHSAGLPTPAGAGPSGPNVPDLRDIRRRRPRPPARPAPPGSSPVHASSIASSRRTQPASHQRLSPADTLCCPPRHLRAHKGRPEAGTASGWTGWCCAGLAACSPPDRASTSNLTPSTSRRLAQPRRAGSRPSRTRCSRTPSVGRDDTRPGDRRTLFDRR